MNIIPIKAKGIDTNVASVILTSMLNIRIIKQTGVRIPVTKSPKCSAKNSSIVEQSSATDFFMSPLRFFEKKPSSTFDNFSMMPFLSSYPTE